MDQTHEGEPAHVEKVIPSLEREQDAEYDQIASNFMDDFDLFATENFGERCAEFEAGCPCCELWKLRDQVREIVII